MTVIILSLVAVIAIMYIVMRVAGYHLHIDCRCDDEVRRCREVDHRLRDLGY